MNDMNKVKLLRKKRGNCLKNLQNDINATNKYATFLLPLLLITIDYIAIVCAEQAAFSLRNFLITFNGTLHISWLNFWVVFPLVYLLFVAVEHPYNLRVQFYKEIQKLFYAVGYGTIAVILILYFGNLAGSTSRLFVTLLGAFSFINLVLFRYVFKKFLEKYELLQIPVLIIGAGKTAEILVKAITTDAGLGYKVIGLLEDNQVKSKLLSHYKVLGGFKDAEDVIKATGVQQVFIAAPRLEQDKLTSLIYRVQPLVKNVGIIPNLIGIPMGEIEVESFFNEKLMLLRVTNNLARPFNRFIKMVFDYVLTLVGTIAISPILAIIAIWIYKDSPGPVIFKHTRIGKDGKPFPCYKFRSMCVDAKERLEELLANNAEARAEWERDFKLKNDPRITKSGAFLRKTSLDELPQIFNVLRGEMSLVGPRPIIQEELERYGEHTKDYLMVKPGITGMWQVSGRSDIDYAERVALDSWYVRNWSVWIDVMLLWRTFDVVLRRKGAY